MADSDWEVVQNKDSKSIPSNSDWEVSPAVQNLNAPTNEPFALSALAAIPRVIGDVATGAYGLLSNIPNYYESAKTEVPGLLRTAVQHPGSLGVQALAGSQEAINKLAQFPKALAEYGANRLNLLPQAIPRAISAVTPEDTSQAINQLFPQPQYPGEALGRGILRNIPEIIATKSIGSKFNPLRYTTGGVAKNIVKTEEKMKGLYNKKYEKLFDKADQKGLGITVDVPKLAQDFNLISGNASPRYYQSLGKFLQSGAHRDAQTTISDMGKLARSLEKKDTLLDIERDMLNAAKGIKQNLQENMFKDVTGAVDKRLAKEYEHIQSGYKKEVVPYTTSRPLQAYKRQDITKKELVEALKSGPFAAKRGAFHPELKRHDVIKQLLSSTWGKALLGGAVGAGGYHYLTGK